jgi:glycosyltransferase involved in cell wall biosynthesis
MKPKTIFLTRNGLMEPLGQSQVLRYLIGLSEDFNFTIISFEKKNDLQNTSLRTSIQSQCDENNINWVVKKYTNSLRPFSLVIDILKMTIACFFEAKKGANLIHARSYIPAIVAMIVGRVLKINYIFDMRALWPEELITSGRIKRNSFLHKMLLSLERRAINNAISIVTLTNASLAYICDLYDHEISHKKVAVIPTCTDLNKFYPSNKKSGYVIGCSGSVLSGWFDLEKLAAFYSFIAKKNPLIKFEVTTKDNQSIVTDFLHRRGVPIDRLKVFSSTVENMPSVNQQQCASVMFYKQNQLSELGRSPTRMAEVLGCGNPVVSNSGVGDVAEIVNQYNVGVILDDYNEINLEIAYKLLIELVSDPKTSYRCREAAEKVFSISTGVKSYAEIYNEANSS